MNIVLFGFKNCGKTTIGKLLAEKLHMQFIDLDRVIEDLYCKKYHEPLSVREIYAEIKEKEFRLLEQDAVSSLASIDNSIIATGGGAVLNKNSMLHLKNLGQMVYLRVAKGTIKQRMLADKLPAFLDPDNPDQSFEEMYKTREAVYENIAAIVINAEGTDNDKIVKKVIDGVKNGE